MYAWIWRKLPFGVWGKLLGSLVLLAGVGALLWYVRLPGRRPAAAVQRRAGDRTGREPADVPVPADPARPSTGDEPPYGTADDRHRPSPSR